jgi:hypothetical protein
MQSKPIDAERFTVRLCVAPPELRVDPMTGQPRTDREGRTQWVVAVAVRPEGGRRSDSDVIDVVVPGEPQGLAEGMPVRLVDLWATEWSIDGRSGTSWRAGAVTPMPAPAPASAPGRGKSGGES